MKKILLGVLLTLSTLFAIDAEGFGKTAAEAKKAALSELSNIVSAKISSELKTALRTHGDKMIKDADKSLKVSSQTYFQGVKYSSVQSRADGEYSVVASLDQEGVENTISFLKDALSVDLNNLSRRELNELLNKSEMLYALGNFSADKKRVHDFVTKKNSAVIKYLTHAKVSFYLEPKNAKLLIENRVYKPFQTYLLPAQSYHYKVSAQGYHSEEGVLYANGGDRINKKVTLIKESAKKGLFYIDVDPELFDSASEVLSQYKLQATKQPEATNALKFTFHTLLVTTIEDMKVYNLFVTVKAYKGNEVILTKKAKLKNVTDQIMERKKSKGVAALTRYILKKVDMNDFIGKVKVSY